uniref:tRNA (cytosine(34)-C(5))-methyltransferase n=1 Tax=Eptatretus burgeri TaxID=7764 RepID=A0A8C4Q6H6_EPTBU
PSERTVKRRLSKFADDTKPRVKEDSGESIWGAGYAEIIKENRDFERYYREQGIVPTEEWNDMMEALRQPLPVTFRITGYRSHAEELLRSLKVYPNGMAWEINLSRKIIRKSPILERFHNFLVFETESGNISRQEAVSMIPPLLLEVEPHHKVLDLCAAPGFKTAQIIDMLHADVNTPFAGELFSIVKRLGSPCVLVCNHDGGQFPRLYLPPSTTHNGRTFLDFDRVLCDVPCSGDGTLRKNLDVWMKWNVENALNLHRQQVRLMVRASELLAIGGRLVYSTCSLNPVENEAVVKTLQLSSGSVVLYFLSCDGPQVSALNPPSMHLYKQVMTRDGHWFSAWSDVNSERPGQLRPSMFPPNDTLDLHRCIRILPHHQNTGGFFVAVIEKKTTLPWSKQQPKSAWCLILIPFLFNSFVCNSFFLTQHILFGMTTFLPLWLTGLLCPRPPPNKRRKLMGFKEDPFVFLKEDDAVFSSFEKFYGLHPKFPRECVLMRTHMGKKRNLYMVSPQLRQFLIYNSEFVKVINTGMRMWSCNSDMESSGCMYRLSQEGIYTILPYISSRIMAASYEDVLVLLTQENPCLSKFSPELRSQAKEFGIGSVLLKYQLNQERDDSSSCPLVMCGWRGKISLHCFMKRNDRLHYLRLLGVNVSPDSLKPEVELGRQAKDMHSKGEMETGVKAEENADLGGEMEAVMKAEELMEIKVEENVDSNGEMETAMKAEELMQIKVENVDSGGEMEARVKAEELNE